MKKEEDNNNGPTDENTVLIMVFGPQAHAKAQKQMVNFPCLGRLLLLLVNKYLVHPSLALAKVSDMDHTGAGVQ